MRLILFFDLPSITKHDLKVYRKFVKLLKENGFSMFQESVYTKLCLNDNVANSTLNVIEQSIPKDGMISCLKLSEKQFSSIINILGEIKTDVLISDEKFTKL